MRGGHRRGQSRFRPRRLIVKLSQVEISAESQVASAVGGFFERIKEDKLSMGRLDPLFARVLVLEAQVCLLLQFCVLRFGLLQDRDVLVGVFPEDQEFVVG